MSTVEKPSEQLQVLLNSHKEFAAGDLEAFADRYTEDFTRELLPSNIEWPGQNILGESSKTQYLSRMQFARTYIYTDDFNIKITDVVEQPGKLVVFALKTVTTTLELDNPFKAEFVTLADLRREPDGKLRIAHLKEYQDSVSMGKFRDAMLAKKFPVALPT